jgi:hypothetical protein
MAADEARWKIWARSHLLLIYFFMAFTFTWTIGGLCLFAPAVAGTFSRRPSLTNPLFYLAVYVPSLSSIILTAVFGGCAGLRKLYERLIPWRTGIQWYLFVLIVYPMGAVIAGEIAGAFTGVPVKIQNWAHLYLLLLPALIVDPGPLGEELGWRGFALPRMLERWSPLSASLILGLIWGLWHLPAFFISGLAQNRMALPVFLLATISVSIIDTWLFLRTNGNLLLPILVHLMTNTTFKALGVSFVVSVVMGVTCAAIIVLAGGLRRGPIASDQEMA